MVGLPQDRCTKTLLSERDKQSNRKQQQSRCSVGKSYSAVAFLPWISKGGVESIKHDAAGLRLVTGFLAFNGDKLPTSLKSNGHWKEWVMWLEKCAKASEAKEVVAPNESEVVPAAATAPVPDSPVKVASKLSESDSDVP